MRYEGKTQADAVAAAAKDLSIPESQLNYKIVRDERSFWGGRVVEIEVEAAQAGPTRESRESRVQPEDPESFLEAEFPPLLAETRSTSARPIESRQPASEDLRREPSRAARGPAPEGSMDEEAFSVVEATLIELLSAAGFLVEVRRREGLEMLFELIGDDVEPLLASKGEGLTGLEVLTGRIAGKRLGRPVYPRLDAEGFRAHQRESLEELALRSAQEAKRTRRPQLLPPLPPGERRLVHLALAQDPEVETESEGEGFLKRVAVRPKAS